MHAAARFRQETDLTASAIAPGHLTGASVRAARQVSVRLDGECLIISAANRRCILNLQRGTDSPFPLTVQTVFAKINGKSAIFFTDRM